MAQTNYPNQLHRSAPQLPYPGQIHDPRIYQQQQHQQYQPRQQQYQQYPQHYSIDAQPQPSYPVQQQPQQHPVKQSRHPPSLQPQRQFSVSSSFSQPITQQYRPPPSPQPPAHSRSSNQPPPSPRPLQHQPHPFAARPSPSPQPQRYLPYAQFSGHSPSSPQSRSMPSPTHEQATASPRPRYAYLPQRSGSQPPEPGNNSFGRPLPTPRGRPESMPPLTRSPMPPPGSSILRQPSASPVRSPLPPSSSVTSIPPPLHRPSISSSSPSSPNSNGPSQFSPRPNSPAHPSRPLPTPIPRSSKVRSLDMRNMNIRTPSPVKGYSSPMPSVHEGQTASSTVETSSVPLGARKRIALPPAAAPGQPFLPHWKRSLPGPQIQVASLKHGIDVQRRGTVSAVTSDVNRGVGLNRATTLSSGRPLPAFPVRTSPAHDGLTESSHMDMDGGDDRSQARTPSPQYGILDLPRSRFAARAEAQPEQIENKAANGTRNRSSTLPQVPNVGQSVTLQMASISINDKGSRQSKAPAFSDWPANLPPLPRAPAIPSKNSTIDLDDAPPPSLRRTPSPSPSVQPRASSVSSVPIRRTHEGTPQRTSRQKISFPADPRGFDSDSGDDNNGPMISISVADTSFPQTFITPASSQIPTISVGNDPPTVNTREMTSAPPVRRGGGLSCGGCRGAIIGRIVSAMGVRWHPGCFRCCVCDELLENLSSYEKDGRPYCHLDYHEAYAPKCYHCHTTIVDEQFVTLDDHELGTRTYHEQHFFCAECGDPFLPPSSGNRRFAGDGVFEDDDVGFTVYKGHPYCESCHVRLRMPKCKRCKKSIRDGMKAVEALGGKWCWGCFVCAGCERPFEDPSFFQRDNHPFCERCFSIIIKNEL